MSWCLASSNALDGSSGTIWFRGAVETQSSKKGLALIGDVHVEALDVTASKAGLKLRVKGKGGDGLVQIGAVTLTGSSVALLGRMVDFTGPITVDGSMAALSAHDLLGAVIQVRSDGGDDQSSMTLQFRDAIDTSIETDFGISKIKADRFVNSDPADAIAAAWIGSLAIRNEATMGLDLINPNPGRPALGSVKAGRIGGGSWQVAGDTGSISAGEFAGGFTGLFGGSVKSLKISGDAGDVALNARRIVSFRVGSDLVRSRITLSAPFDPDNPGAVTMNHFKVAGHVDDVVVRSAGSLGTIQVGTLNDVTFFAGITDAVADDLLPSDADNDFDALAHIRRVKVTGLRDEPVWIHDARFGASNIGGVTAGYASGTSGGPHGFAAVTFGTLSYRDDQQRISLRGTALNEAGDIPFGDDLIVRVL